MSRSLKILEETCKKFGDFMCEKKGIKIAKIEKLNEYGLKIEMKDIGNIRFYINNNGQIKLVNGNLKENEFEEIVLLWEIFQNGEEYLKGVHIFVDGSFKDRRAGYGFLIIRDGKIVEKRSGEININLNMKNIPGEIKAVIEAIELCKLRGWDEIYLHYDYTGLKKWADLEWKAKNELTKEYQNYMLNASKKIKINWIKEKAHGKSMLNAIADKLAKKR